jgi:5'-deoxynucleotidase YfbR-like HD superfamily hydrolase
MFKDLKGSFLVYYVLLYETDMTTQSSSVDPTFLFAIPEVSDLLSAGAKTAIQIGALAGGLVAVERTRCIHPDGRAENVAEHSLMLAKVAPELADLLYPNLNANLVARFALLHDDVEVYVGDTPTDMLANADPAYKEIREAEGAEQLAKDYAGVPNYVKLLHQYETQSVPEARFVRAVDKLMVLLIHFPNEGATLRANYTYETYMQSERDLLDRHAYKYGEFSKVIDLRRELGQKLANKHL